MVPIIIRVRIATCEGESVKEIGGEGKKIVV
jgi:hypothetical protein